MRDGDRWTDQELQVSVETYLYLLRLEHSGHQMPESAIVDLLSDSPVGRRRQSSLRYRLRNISAVLVDHGLPRLRAYSPAPRVGTGVRARIERLLFSQRPEALEINTAIGFAAATPPDPVEALNRAEGALERALEALQGLTDGSGSLGHNNPPEAIENFAPDDIRDAISTIRDARAGLLAGMPSRERFRVWADKLSRFGVRLAAKGAELFWDAAGAGLRFSARVAAMALLLAVPPVADAVGVLLKLL